MASSTRLANEAWEALLSAHAVLIKRFAAENIWGTVSMREYDVLYTLSKCPEPIRLSQLGRHLLLSQPALSRMVDRLVERGLIERCTDPRDGRGILLSLTPDGAECQRAIGRRHAVDVAQAIGTALSPEEMLALRELTAKLTATDE